MKLFAKSAKSVFVIGALIGAMSSSAAYADLKLIGSGASGLKTTASKLMAFVLITNLKVVAQVFRISLTKR